MRVNVDPSFAVREEDYLLENRLKWLSNNLGAQVADSFELFSPILLQ